MSIHFYQKVTATISRTLLTLFFIFLFFRFPLLAQNSPPNLVVFIVVDQMREDTFDRFGDLFQGGLKYLQEEGVYFENAYHAHAYPATGPGHFVLASGRYPGSEGIIGNSWYDRDKKGYAYCVADSQTNLLGGNGRKVSFRNIGSSALGDWMKEADGSSIVYSIAGKDRAAVFMGGKKPNGVFWFDFDIGEYVTTDYYMERYPWWLEQFKEAKAVDKYVGRDWTRFFDDEAIYLKRSREDDFPKEIILAKEAKPVFPHHFPEPEKGQSADYQRLWQLPWLPETSLQLAKAIVTNVHLGEDGHPDLLCIGVSVTDAIGHDYGPFSQEVMDMFLRLDRMLGDFFDFLDGEIGLDHVLIVLSSDHGVAMLPEYARQLGLKAGRFGSRYKALKDEFNAILADRWGKGEFIESISNASIYYNTSTLRSEGITVQKMDSLVVSLLLREKWVSKVYTRNELHDDSSLEYEKQLWRNQFHPQNSGDLFLVFKENWVYRESFGTAHGTTHPYDTHVPLIFAGNGLNHRSVDDKVETVDVAPTIAKMLQIEYPAEVDGKALDLSIRPKNETGVSHR